MRFGIDQEKAAQASGLKLLEVNHLRLQGSKLRPGSQIPGRPGVCVGRGSLRRAGLGEAGVGGKNCRARVRQSPFANL